ncbi:hypothetical protein SCP_0309430 [Sparassis crispa]|uniref:Uncharacterized protein n=1 Tax=Sparassis crispa TaxID=139825 RepID=A0A401GGA5_9APHY|nr:hypothetical protein SCP_0309430 [Sparassis crispa]GBE81216.1 hypothetical protein SCP_0309430 [Sparassis crispa]
MVREHPTQTFARNGTLKEEYPEKARQHDQEEKERMQENEERLKQGKKPKKDRRDDLPKPTELMKRREGDLEPDKSLDSVGYLDHINGRAHLCALGQTTRIERSIVEQVRARIAYLREKTREASTAKSFDFKQRLAESRDREAALCAEKEAAKEALRERARVELAKEIYHGC